MCLGCGGGTSGPDSDPPPILGSCNVEPNYIAQVSLNRWREFPLGFHLDDSAFPSQNRDRMLAQLVDGINAWAVSTGHQIGSVIRVNSPEEADFIIVVQDFNGSGAALTTHSGGSPFLHGGRIAFDRQTLIELSELEGSQILPALAAHEMGHLLGILGHPATENVLMHAPLQAANPTTEDINTLSHAYCEA